MTTNGVTELTPRTQVLGAGVWLRNYDTGATFAANVAAGRVIGPTKGGNEITIQREYVDHSADIDGARGRIKGMTQITKDTATIKATFATLTVSQLVEMIPGASVSTELGVSTITSGDVTDADYLTNIAWVGDHADAGDGTVGLIISNPLALEPVVLAPERDSKLGPTLSMEAHYDPSNMSTAPWLIFMPSDASVS